METTKIVHKVQEYLKRADKPGERDKAKSYDLHEEGLWRVVPGTTSERGTRNRNDAIYQGTFLDVVTLAVQSTHFGGWWITHDNHPDNGYVEKIEPVSVEPNNVYGIQAAELYKEQVNLDEQIAELERQKEVLGGLEKTLT